MSHSRRSSRCASTARTSGTLSDSSFFFARPLPVPLQHQEPPRQERQRDMMVPPHPTARLVLVQTTLALARLKTLFHRPVAAAYVCHLVQRHFLRSVRAVIL